MRNYMHNKKYPTKPTADPNKPPIHQIKFYLDKYRIKEALQIFFDENTLKLLRVDADFMWDIIPLICKRLRGLCQYRFRVFEGCERMLCRIAVEDSCNPKEVLISLLAEIGQPNENGGGDDNIFRAMIRPLEGTLLRMNHPSPRDENFRWALNVLLRHVNDIDLPQEYNLEGKKRLALPNDPSVKRFIEVLPLVLSFIEGFSDRPLNFDKAFMPILTESQIDEVFNGELIDDDLMTEHGLARNDSLDASVTALLGLMYRPLAFLDLTTCCPDLRLFSNRCLNILLKFRPNLFSSIYKRLSDKSTISNLDCYNIINSGLCNESSISLATCSYLYRCEREISLETVQSFPQVVTHESMLICHIPYIVALLERTEILVHEKGILLLESLLKYVEPDSLDQRFLDIFEASSLLKYVLKLTVYSPLCTNRRKAYELFTGMCDVLTNDCKLRIFKYILTQTELRPCIRATCIDQYRKHLTNVYRELMNLHHQLSVPSFDGSKTDSRDNSQFNQNQKDLPKTRRVKSESYDGSTDLRGIANIEPSANKQTAVLPANPAMVRRMKHLHKRYKTVGGAVLTEFLDACIKACLPDSQHTDIIENYELLLATLTMFRFLKLRKTVFRDEIEEEYLSGKRLKKVFFDPVRNAIASIMNDLKLHHKEVVDGHKMKNTKITQNSIMNVTQSRNEFDLLSRILGPKLDEFISPKPPEFNEQDEADCLNWALCRLDLVESVLVRTCDLYNC